MRRTIAFVGFLLVLFPLIGGQLSLRAEAGPASLPGVTVGPLFTKETKVRPSHPAIPPSLEYFGQSVAISGDTAVVGCQSGSGTDVFVRRNGVWSHQQKLTVTVGGVVIPTGGSVAVSGDTVAVSGKDDVPGSFAGAVYVFTRSDGVWSQQQKLTSDYVNELQRSYFGFSVAVSGDTVLVGAVLDQDAGINAGAVFVFVRNDGRWTFQEKLKPAQGGVWFGYSVAMSGDVAIAGSPFSYDAGDNSGSAYVFDRREGSWTRHKLTAGDAAAGKVFGGRVAISADTVVVGSSGDFDDGLYTGAAYVFVRSGTGWTQQQKLKAADPETLHGFGTVAVSGDTVLVGASGDRNAGLYSGAGYVFVRNGTVWSQVQKLIASDSASYLGFGYSVGLSGNTAIVGAPFSGLSISSPGQAYLYEPELTGLSPARVWVGLRNSDDVGIRFDLQGNVSLNDADIGSGQLDGVWGGSSGINNATLSVISLAPAGPVVAHSGDTLRIDVLVRNACSGSGKNSGTARLWFNGPAVDSGPARGAGSRFGATIGGTSDDYFLRAGFSLKTTAGQSPLFIDVPVGAKCGAFVPFGTWSATLP